MVTAHPTWQSAVTPCNPSRRQRGTCLCQLSAPGLAASLAAWAEELWDPCAEPRGGTMGSPLLFCPCGGDPQVSPRHSAESSARWHGSRGTGPLSTLEALSRAAASGESPR